VVAVGGSAGGVEALSAMAAGLPEDLPFAVLMALHVPSQAPSVLADIIDRRTAWPAVAARDGMKLEPGRIYVAVPGRHLLTHNHRVMLSDGPTESGHRPALNAMFRSVAKTFGPRAIGVLMSGVLDDGVLGLAAIRSQGGTTVCQSPEDALFSAMPRNALTAGVVDHSVAAADVGALLGRLARRADPGHRPVPDPYLDIENRIAMSHGFGPTSDGDTLGAPSGFACPDCGGSLQNAGEDYYRCHVGHAWTADALLAARDGEVDRALWVAVRALVEKARLAHQLADKSALPELSERYGLIAEETDRALAVLRGRLTAAENGTRLPHD